MDVRRREPIDPEHPGARLGELVHRRAPHRAEAHDHDVVRATHPRALDIESPLARLVCSAPSGAGQKTILAAPITLPQPRALLNNARRLETSVLNNS
jgi:hypothetical protein